MLWICYLWSKSLNMNHNLTINQKKHQYPVFCCLRPIIDIIVQHVLPKILDIVVSFVLSLWYMNKLNGLYECSLGLVEGCRGFAPAEAWARLRVLQGGARDPQGLSQSALQVDRLLSGISLFIRQVTYTDIKLSVRLYVCPYKYNVHISVRYHSKLSERLFSG